LLPWFYLRARRFIVVPLLCLLWIAGPMMGLCWHSARPGNGGALNGRRLRIMTYNVKDGLVDPRAAAQAIADARPDVLFAQEVTAARAQLDTVLDGWNVRSDGQYLVASRLPISRAEILNTSTGDSPSMCMRCRVRVGDRTVTVFCAHLITPRPGLRAFEDADEGSVPIFTNNTDLRLEQASRLAQVVRAERQPVIVAGDLNAPVQSLVCRRLFSAGLRDAFSETGRGYGYTYGHRYALGNDYVRIDHVMVSPEWRVLACTVGGREGSDHCPVTADILLPDAK
jgi:endonuclease/exonuclease/phosphatase family metal-dependent hydrolase